jgi:hypothetical protein
LKTFEDFRSALKAKRPSGQLPEGLFAYDNMFVLLWSCHAISLLATVVVAHHHHTHHTTSVEVV